MQDLTKSDMNVITTQTNENTMSIENLYHYIKTQLSNNLKQYGKPL